MNKILSVIFCVAVLSARAFAGPVALGGRVIGADGRPVRDAEVRIQAAKPKTQSPAVTTRTDAKGNFAVRDLKAGLYRADVLVAGKLQSSMPDIQVPSAKAAALTLDLKRSRAAGAIGGKKKTKFVWMPAETGSHLGGHYVEVDDDGNTEPDAQNVQKGNGDAVRQFQNRNPNIKDPSSGGFGR